MVTVVVPAVIVVVIRRIVVLVKWDLSSKVSTRSNR